MHFEPNNEEPSMPDLARLRAFVQAFTGLADTAGANEARMLGEGKLLLAALVTQDDWLPDRYARPHPERYQQYLLYCDPGERFSVVSFVWGPGQSTPVHDHTVWGMVGVLRGAELCEEWGGSPLAKVREHRLEPGQVDLVSPAIGDIHRVSNALADQVSVSIHVYGANIGKVRRHVFDPVTGAAKGFVSGYANAEAPDL
jgi:predicted metal-dependent enzyme (double-stranded beta helix superfamily)